MRNPVELFYLWGVLCISIQKQITGQFWKSQIFKKYRNQAKAGNNHITLYNQLRMQVDSTTMDWKMVQALE